MHRQKLDQNKINNHKYVRIVCFVTLEFVSMQDDVLLLKMMNVLNNGEKRKITFANSFRN